MSPVDVVVIVPISLNPPYGVGSEAKNTDTEGVGSHPGPEIPVIVHE
jgi:hypothetical protein